MAVMVVVWRRLYEADGDLVCRQVPMEIACDECEGVIAAPNQVDVEVARRTNYHSVDENLRNLAGNICNHR